MPLYKRARAAQERGRGRGTTRDGRETRGGGQELRHPPANKRVGSRERWRAAREKATADKTAEVAAAVDQLRREAATAAGRGRLKLDRLDVDRISIDGTNDGTKPSTRTPRSSGEEPRGRRREAAATHSSALPSYNPSAPWEWLAQGAGTASVEDYALGDSPADRAAAFAALLNDKHGGIGNVLASGDFENSVDEGDFESPERANAFPGAYIPGVKGMPGRSFDEDEDEDDEELRERKRKMKNKLKELAARRAEVVGDGTPKTAKVTVAKFTNELKAFTQLRDDLSDWSDNFLARNGRRPTVKDAERTGIDFLIRSFKEYVELRDRLMSQTPYLRGQMEDVAKETLPTPRVTRDGARRGRAAGVRDGIGAGARRASSAARRQSQSRRRSFRARRGGAVSWARAGTETGGRCRRRLPRSIGTARSSRGTSSGETIVRLGVFVFVQQIKKKWKESSTRDAHSLDLIDSGLLAGSPTARRPPPSPVPLEPVSPTFAASTKHSLTSSATNLCSLECKPRPRLCDLTPAVSSSAVCGTPFTYA